MTKTTKTKHAAGIDITFGEYSNNFFKYIMKPTI